MHYTTTATDAVEFATLPEAKDAADKITLEQRIEVQVLGHVVGQDEPILVGHTSPFVTPEGVKSVHHFAPWTRIEVIPTTWIAPFVAGMTLAYSRKRIATGVYRPNTKGGQWLVWNTQSGERAFALGTKGAREITNRMGRERRSAPGEAPVEA